MMWFEEQTPIAIFLNGVILFLFYLAMRRARQYPYKIGKRNEVVGLFLILLFCLFSFWGADWFHYRDEYEKTLVKGSKHLEDIYIWIITYCSPDYLVFRLIVWGGALWLILRMYNLLPIPYDVSLYLFGLICLIWFSYARVSAAMALQCTGLVLFCSKSRYPLWHKICGLSLIAVSVFFHKSAFFGVVCSYAALVMLINTKYGALLCAVSIPILLSYARENIVEILIIDNMSGQEPIQQSLQAGQSYIKSEEVQVGLNTAIQQFLERIPYYLTAVLVFLAFLNKKIRNAMPMNVKVMAAYLITIVSFASIFAFDFGIGVNTTTLYGRFIRFGCIPMSVWLGYLFVHRNFHFRLTRNTIRLAIWGVIYTLVYTFYNCYISLK